MNRALRVPSGHDNGAFGAGRKIRSDLWRGIIGIVKYQQPRVRSISNMAFKRLRTLACAALLS